MMGGIGKRSMPMARTIYRSTSGKLRGLRLPLPPVVSPWARCPCYLFLKGPLMRIRSLRVLPFSVIRDNVYTDPSFPTAIEFT